MSAPRLSASPAQARLEAMSTDKSSTRRRRPQAERTAEMRARLIQAAIACLYRSGYTATTVSAVADEAGVSRGAMTHHFKAKTDLMLAVVQSVFESDSDAYNQSIREMEPARWLERLPQTMWGVMSKPSGIAVMEIMLASRSDPELGEQLRTLQKAIDERSHEWSSERVRAAGLTPVPQAEAIHELYVAAVRGLALEAVFMNNDAGVQRSLQVLSDLMRRIYPDIEDKL
jgi:AcrR family transcriptional regulator